MAAPDPRRVRCDPVGEWNPTPPEGTVAFLACEAPRILRAAVGPKADTLPKPGDVDILEPCCGDGAMARVLETAGFRVHASDLHDRGYGRTGVDFLAMDELPSRIVVTNPPWSQAAAFIRHAGERGASYMALLLPLEFWSARSRDGVWDRFPPSTVYACTWRMDFVFDGAGRNNRDVMWCVWANDWRGPTQFARMHKPRWSL